MKFVSDFEHMYHLNTEEVWIIVNLFIIGTKSPPIFMIVWKINFPKNYKIQL